MNDKTSHPGLVAAWIAAMRPRTLTAAVGAVAVGAALARAAGAHRWDATFAALGVAVSLQIASNLYNDYGDFIRGADVDRVGPPRAAQSGWLAASHVRLGAFIAIAVAVLSGLRLVALLGWPALAIGVTAIVSAVAYTAGPAPLAYIGLGDAFVMAFFGVAAVNGTFLAETGKLSASAGAASVAVGAMATAILVVNNLRDHEGDARVGKRTLVVRFGQRFGQAEYIAMLALAYLIAIGLAYGERRAGWLLPLLTLPLAVKRTRTVLGSHGLQLNAELANTAKLGLAFNLLLAAGALA